MKRQKHCILDLFCGAGGLSEGFSKAGFSIIAGIDFDKTCIETFRRNHKNSFAVIEDMRKINAGQIKKISCGKKIDVIVGGPPCQGFSMAGKRIPNDPRNSLFKEFLRIVNGIKPKLFVMENVIGLLSMRNSSDRKVIDIIKGEFRKIGYDANEYVINTADYGVPQKRKRVFVIGTRKGYSFKLPEPTHSENGFTANGGKIRFWTPVKKVLEQRNMIDKSYFYSKMLASGFRRRERQNRKQGYGFGWKFLNINKPSYTISARYYKDGADALIKYPDGSIRMLTPAECALIQSFPRSYKFSGSERKVYEQIGNAVPPKIGYVIATSIRKSLEKSYE